MGIEDSVVEKICGYCRDHTIRVMYLFGSYARGEATPSSDIDLVEQNAIENPIRRKRIIEERVLLYAS